MTAAPVYEVLSKLQGVRKTGGGWTARCPAHDDHENSLSIGEGDDGKVLVKCFTGCPIEAVTQALGMEMSELFADPADSHANGRVMTKSSAAGGGTVATHAYQIRDAQGALVAVHNRIDLADGGKRIWWQRPGYDGPGLHGLALAALPLYRTEHAAGWEARSMVVVTEGEKAADALTLLGFHAVGTFGAEALPLPAALEVLRPFDVVLWPDHDPPGERHMGAVAAALAELGIRARVFLWPEAPPKGDAADWTAGAEVLKARLAAADSLLPVPAVLREVAPAYEHDRLGLSRQCPLGEFTLTLRAEALHQDRSGLHARLSILDGDRALAWSSFNVERDEDRVRLANSAHKQLGRRDLPAGEMKHALDDFVRGLWAAYVRNDMSAPVDGATHPDPPTQLIRDFLLDGGGTILFGPPERGKSWALLLMAVCLDAGLSQLWGVQQVPTLFINLERSARSLQNRLGAVNRALGLPANRPLEMMNRRGRSLADIEGAVGASVEEKHIRAVFVDSITRAGAGDLTENGPANRTIDMMNGLCPSWMGVAHTPRGDDTHLFGSQMFDAGADITVRTLGELRDDERGVGLIRTKGNDLPTMREPQVLALRFDADANVGLVGVRRARLTDFPNLLVAGKNQGPEDQIVEHLREVGKDTATNIAKTLGVHRSNVVTLLRNSSHFINLGREGKEVYYGAL